MGGWEKVRFLSAGISRPSDENQQKVVSRCCWFSLSLSLSLSLPTGRPIAFNELTHHVVIFVVEHWSTENRQIEKRERRRTRERFLFLRRGGRNKKCFVSLSFISFLFF